MRLRLPYGCSRLSLLRRADVFRCFVGFVGLLNLGCVSEEKYPTLHLQPNKPLVGIVFTRHECFPYNNCPTMDSLTRCLILTTLMRQGLYLRVYAFHRLMLLNASLFIMLDMESILEIISFQIYVGFYD